MLVSFTRPSLLIAVVACGGALGACSTRAPLAEGGVSASPKDDDPNTSSGGRSGSSTSGSGNGNGRAGAGTAGGGGGGNVGGGDAAACMTFSAAAVNSLRPADVILAVDQSGSMDLETEWVRVGLNSLATKVAASGVDMRVVVIAESGDVPNSLCVPAPLGSGRCPGDENSPLLTRVNQHVHSRNALKIILGVYSDYADVLRDSAIKHIIVVTDDDSDLPADAFRKGLKALAPQSFADFYFHGIYAFTSPECAGGYNACCDVSANEGLVYRDLVAATGGVESDLCEQHFAPVWDAVSESIANNAPFRCDWAVPDPPDRMVVDPEAIDVTVSVDGSALDVTRVADSSACSAYGREWYYDDSVSPAQLHACPEFCADLQDADDVSVEILFGCKEMPPTF